MVVVCGDDGGSVAVVCHGVVWWRCVVVCRDDGGGVWRWWCVVW